eukprot:scaffold1809_cov386-Prasinococcus_capsulatus_cf.AAC.32
MSLHAISPVDMPPRPRGTDLHRPSDGIQGGRSNGGESSTSQGARNRAASVRFDSHGFPRDPVGPPTGPRVRKAREGRPGPRLSGEGGAGASLRAVAAGPIFPLFGPSDGIARVFARLAPSRARGGRGPSGSDGRRLRPIRGCCCRCCCRCCRSCCGCGGGGGRSRGRWTGRAHADRGGRGRGRRGARGARGGGGGGDLAPRAGSRSPACARRRGVHARAQG